MSLKDHCFKDGKGHSQVTFISEPPPNKCKPLEDFEISDFLHDDMGWGGRGATVYV